MPPVLIICQEVVGKRVVDVNVEGAASCGLCGLGPHLVAFQNYRVVELRAGIFTMPSVMLFCIFPKCLRLRELDGIVADAFTELKGVVVVQTGTFESHLAVHEDVLQVFQRQTVVLLTVYLSIVVVMVCATALPRATLCCNHHLPQSTECVHTPNYIQRKLELEW